ncbi:uncharacterized protein LOC129756219 [Uranotaenia lowii]|uniref:uncharacterized protein LOC129756219 n=1 Tax=Uranotaenia lowii TaxID=190385 RepID=UPI00247AB613|nr:uncharacterized protein LOC129756219 [Uranotaenia lowii]
MDIESPTKVKQEPMDLEQAIPRFCVASGSGADEIPTRVETIDLTKEEFLTEFMNFVEAIQVHRKTRTSLRSICRQRAQKVEEFLPLQVVHIQLITFYQEAYVCSLFGLDFKKIMIYGRVIPGTVRQENNTHIYRLDDGTGSVEVHYPHGLKRDLDNMAAVNSCENILNSRTALNEDQVPDDPEQLADLKQLLSLIKTRCKKQVEYFPLGSHCFIIGRPFLNRTDRVSIFAYSMHADDSTIGGPTTELFWKTHLAQCYERRYMSEVSK